MYASGIADRTASATSPSPMTAYIASPCGTRSEEHTSELQSLTNLVCRLLLEKKRQKLLLYVCRLAKAKNTATLLHALKSLQLRRTKEFHFFVIAHGPDRTKLRKLPWRTHNLSWIRYRADHCELAGFYRAAYLFVPPGVHETFGLAALECQAFGTAVLFFLDSYMDHIICHFYQSWAFAN